MILWHIQTKPFEQSTRGYEVSYMWRTSDMLPLDIHWTSSPLFTRSLCVCVSHSLIGLVRGCVLSRRGVTQATLGHVSSVAPLFSDRCRKGKESSFADPQLTLETTRIINTRPLKMTPLALVWTTVCLWKTGKDPNILSTSPSTSYFLLRSQEQREAYLDN